MPDQEVNRDSLPYIIGRMEERLAQGDKVMTAQTEATDRLSKAISCLPCQGQEERIKALEAAKSRLYSFNDTLKITLIGCIATGFVALLITYFTWGRIALAGG